jgi:hypothetical protein
MREIIPYKTLAGALKGLDNGGRFYNLFTNAGDGKITDAELCKAAGVVAGMDKAFLFFTLALSRMGGRDLAYIQSQVAPDLRVRLSEDAPRKISIPEFEKAVKLGEAVIVEGFPRFLEDRTELAAFVIIPITTGKTTTFTMIPIFDQFDVYELYEDEACTSLKTIIATVRGSKRLETERMVFGGIAKKLDFAPRSKRTHRAFLEVLYYVK